MCVTVQAGIAKASVWIAWIAKCIDKWGSYEERPASWYVIFTQTVV